MFSDEAIREGKADLIGVGMAFLSDSEWVVKAAKILKLASTKN